MKTNKLLAGVMSAILYVMIPALVVVPLVGLTGCTKAEVVQTIDTLESQLPQVAQLAAGVTALVAPEYAPLIAPGAAAIGVAGKTLEGLLAGYNPGVPNPTVLQKINAAFQDIQTNLQSIVTAVGVKDPKTTAIVTTFAGLIGVIVQNIVDLVNQQPAAVAMNIVPQLPAVFGWHISGVDLMAIEGNMTDTHVVPAAKPKLTARDIAKHWNKVCGKVDKAKIKVPRAKVMGISIPGTGH